MDYAFHYVLVVPDFEFEDFTPTAGFSPGLLGFQWAIAKIATLPADIMDPALTPRVRRGRRALGQSLYRWHPLDLSALLRWPPGIGVPLQVLFSQDSATAAAVEGWCQTRAVRPLHVSLSPTGEALSPDQMTRRRLQAFAEGVIAAGDDDGDRSEALRLVRSWPAQRSKRSTLRFRSHNVTVANELVLLSEGIQPSDARTLNPENDRDYVRAIRDSVKAVRELRGDVTAAPGARPFPPRPDLILFAPAMFKALYGRARPGGLDEAAFHATFRTVQRQTGYAFRTDREDEIAAYGQPAWFAINGLRTSELLIQSAGVGLLAASTMSATIRLPAGVNRISGVIGTLANHLRAHPDAQPKTTRVFAAVQTALEKAIDPALLKLIRSAQSGVHVVSDVPLEWLSVDGLPLMLQFETSRVCATPGNLSFGSLINAAQIVIPPTVFDEILHIRSFGAEDPIRDDMQIALNVIAPDADVTVRTVDVQTKAGLVEALNAYEGALVIIDAHGIHETGRPGELLIGKERVDSWSLRGHARIPPIVVLSACDTQAVDRAHATVGNGFIVSGARSVVATFLPVRSHDSAVLVARLVLRAKRFAQAMNRSGFSVSWARVVTYGLRAQLITDVARRIGDETGMDEAAQIEFANQAAKRVNMGEQGWWTDFRGDILAQTGWSPERTDRFLQKAISESDVIRYVHLGSPESILISNAEILVPRI